MVPIGTFRQYVAVERDQVIPSPEHLSDDQVAAWPLGAVTAWRYMTYTRRIDELTMVMTGRRW